MSQIQLNKISSNQSVITEHSNLTGLDNDDHTQYWMSGLDNYRTANFALLGDLSITGEVKANINAEDGFTIETRTSDPTLPSVGRMWLRTDI
jgi:hypothetical protein